MFDNVIGDMISNNKLKLVVTEPFIRGRKLNISLALILQSFFGVQKNVRLNTTHFFIIISNLIPNNQISYDKQLASTSSY